MRRGLDLLKIHYRKNYSLATLPAEDKTTYDMLSRADSVGVFQVESRAQMSMLPRLKPQTFYDLVIEVAYDHMEGRRFRHTAQFRRWRTDRDPHSCGYDQLEEPVSYDLTDVLAT